MTHHEPNLGSLAGMHHFPAIRNRQSHHLFAKYMPASLRRLNGDGLMGMIRSRQCDGIDFNAVEQSLVVSKFKDLEVC